MSIRDGSHGAFRLATLLARLGRYEVATLLRDGRFQQPWPGVVVEADRCLELSTRVAAALLLNGPCALAAGPTAVRLHGCDAISSEIVHVLRPYGPGIRRRQGIALHRGTVPPQDVVRIDDLPVLTLDRAVGDVLCTENLRDAIAVADQALALQPVEMRADFRSRVAGRLAARADRRGTRRGAGVLELATGCAESPPESWLRLLIVELGFPVPEANWSLRTPSGAELYRLDLSWPLLRIAVEYNGYAEHAGREVEDRARADELRRRGWIVITVDRDDLADTTRLRRELTDAFTRRGAPVR